jgi:Winged helix-turn-helix domain (DUF2582)
MELQGKVGETAGRIWHLLNETGPLTLAQLKKKVDGEGEYVGFALGWLSREDKVLINHEKRTYRVQLK